MIGVVDPHAVRRQVRPSSTPSFSSSAVGLMPRLATHLVVFALRLGEVDEQRRAVAVGQRARGLQRLVGVGVEACGATAGTISGSFWKRCEEALR